MTMWPISSSRPCVKLLCAVCTVVICSGCAPAGEDDLSKWMVAERNSIRSSVVPLAEPKNFEPIPYSVSNQTEPYANERLIRILQSGKDSVTRGSALLEMEESRRKQPLEAHPLDAISMVGSLNRNGRPVALVKVNDLLYQVSLGAYLGQNYGRVIAITENELMLREVVQDASGDWTERAAALQLIEESSK